MTQTGILFIAAAMFATTAMADIIPVANASFETVPAGGYNYAGCGAGCDYSENVAAPGWTANSTIYGQFQPGPSSGNFAYFNYIPDGTTVLFMNNGDVYQTTSATVQVGTVYTLQVDLGVRNDETDPGAIYLMIGSRLIQASGTLPVHGTWSTYTATYTGLAGDAGQSIGIELASGGAQGDFDNVRLSDINPVPEPASLTLFAMCAALFIWRRRALTSVDQS